jgi:hypothetical protein
MTATWGTALGRWKSKITLGREAATPGRGLVLLGGLLALDGVGGVGLRPAVARFANSAIEAVPCRFELHGSMPRCLQRDDATRQQHRLRRVGAMGLEIKTQRRGQD